MQFVYPAFLFALAALAIPIILHLFYFRRFKKVYFTNVRFLKEVKEETSARSKLRNLLVLLMRLLAILFLVLAFAQPFIPQDVEVKKGKKAVSVFVDNSFSMSALSQDVPLLDKAKQRAREIIQAYEVDDEFQVLTNDFEGRHQRVVSQEDALSLVDEIEVSPSVKNLSSVLSRQNQALSTGNADNKVAFLVSDFQKNITDLDGKPDSTMEVNLLPLQAVQERNISIDSAWFDVPVQTLNQTNKLIVKIRNLSSEPAENVRLSMRYEGQSRPVGTLEIPAQASVLDTVSITILRTGWHQAELNITDYPVQFDDKYYFTFDVADEINVLIIDSGSPNRYLSAAFEGISYFKLNRAQVQNLDYSSFADYQLIVMDDLRSISSGLSFELNQYVVNGGNLLAFPARDIDLNSFNQFLRTFPANEFQSFEGIRREVGRINTEEFVFSDVFENANANIKLPVSEGNFKMTGYSNRGEELLMRYRDGGSFIAKYQAGQGHLYLSAAPLNPEYNDLVRNGEIFIPMLYKMAISSGRENKIAYFIGQDEVIERGHSATSTELVYKLRGEAEEFIPEQRIAGAKVFLGVNNQIKQAGFYNLFLNEEETLATYGFNYDRQESALEYLNTEALKDQFGSFLNVLESESATVLTGTIQDRSQGVKLWRWCLILALLFLGAEVLLLRFWKV